MEKRGTADVSEFPRPAFKVILSKTDSMEKIRVKDGARVGVRANVRARPKAKTRD